MRPALQRFAPPRLPMPQIRARKPVVEYRCGACRGTVDEERIVRCPICGRAMCVSCQSRSEACRVCGPVPPQIEA